jgi:hypothetical protein
VIRRAAKRRLARPNSTRDIAVSRAGRQCPTPQSAGRSRRFARTDCPRRSTPAGLSCQRRSRPGSISRSSRCSTPTRMEFGWERTSTREPFRICCRCSRWPRSTWCRSTLDSRGSTAQQRRRGTSRAPALWGSSGLSGRSSGNLLRCSTPHPSCSTSSRRSTSRVWSTHDPARSTFRRGSNA